MRQDCAKSLHCEIILFIIIYLLMKQKNKVKLELMSDCLKFFKQIPTNLENYCKSYNICHVMHLVQCSNKFKELSKDSQQPQESQLFLFHRFFFRLREIIYSGLNYYLHTTNYIFIRQLLVQANKEVLGYRPGSGYSDLLQSLSLIIIANVIRIAHAKNFSPLVMDLIKENSLQLQTRSYQEFQNLVLDTHDQISCQQNSLSMRVKQKLIEKQREIERQKCKLKQKEKQREKQREREKEKSKQKLSTQSSLPKLMGYDIMNDIDASDLEKLNKSLSADDLYRQCLNRNRFINQIINRFTQKYKFYQNKPDRKKNRDWAQYQPTILIRKGSKSPQKRSLNNFISTQTNTFNINLKKRLASTSQQKRRAHSKQSQEIQNRKSVQIDLQSFENIEEPFQEQTEDFPYDILKKQIFNQIYAYREKYCLRKVVIGAGNLQTPDLHFHQKLKLNSLRGQPGAVMGQTIRQNRNSAQSQRFKITNRNIRSGNRSYIQGVVGHV